jgi:hypothetical protein
LHAVVTSISGKRYRFYAYKNYLVRANEYRMIPLTFPRSNFKLHAEKVGWLAALNVLLLGSLFPWNSRKGGLCRGWLRVSFGKAPIIRNIAQTNTYQWSINDMKQIWGRQLRLYIAKIKKKC